MALDVVVDPILQAFKMNVLDGAYTLAEGEKGILLTFSSIKADSAWLLWNFYIVLIFKRHAELLSFLFLWVSTEGRALRDDGFEFYFNFP